MNRATFCTGKKCKLIDFLSNFLRIGYERGAPEGREARAVPSVCVLLCFPRGLFADCCLCSRFAFSEFERNAVELYLLARSANTCINVCSQIILLGLLLLLYA